MLKRLVLSLSSTGLVVLFVAGLGSLAGSACGGGAGGGSGGGTASSGGGTSSLDVTCGDAGTLTTTQLFAGVAGMKCKECHFPAGGDGGAAGAGFAYGDYTDLNKFHAATVGAKSKYAGSAGTLKVIDPNNLANSSMWLKLHGGSPKQKGPNMENVGGAMPNDGVVLSDAELGQFKAWICSGANK